jgi:general secretion pathway protein E
MPWPNLFRSSKSASPEPRVLTAVAPAQGEVDVIDMECTVVEAPVKEPAGSTRPSKAEHRLPKATVATVVAANETSGGGLRVAPFVISTTADFSTRQLNVLPMTSMKHSGPKALRVHDSLQGKIVPVAVQGVEGICLLLVSRQYRSGDEVEDVAKELIQRGWKFFAEYQVVEVGPTLLASLTHAGNDDVAARGRDRGDLDTLFRHFRNIVTWGYQNNASDIDFQANRTNSMSRVGFVIDGKWVFPQQHAIQSDLLMKILRAAYQRGSSQASAALEENKEQSLDLHITLEDQGKTSVKLRWASMAGDSIYSVTVRVVELAKEGRSPTLKELGYLPDHLDVFERALVGDGGAYILSGVVNSGKSTTIDALLDCIDSTRKIITIEDPVEKVRTDRISNTVARLLTGEPSRILRSKLMNLKRTGFNDLFLGEIRDGDSARAAQDVFESGQRLFTTLHAGRAWDIPGRLVGLGLERSVLANFGNLRFLGYQALIARNCECAIPLVELMSSSSASAQRWLAYGDRMKRLFNADLAGVRIRNAEGCHLCRRHDLAALNGYSGRTVVAEVIEPDEEFCELIGRGDTLGMLEFQRSLRGDTPYDSVAMAGKSAFDCAVYKVLIGELNPEDVESRFESFKSLLAKAEARKARQQYASSHARNALHRVGATGAQHAA